jgi:hypothetical protein
MTDFTNAVALEISRLLSNWQAGRELAAALARKFPRLTSVELDEALRDVIALRDLAAAEIAESERQLTRLKAELQKDTTVVQARPLERIEHAPVAVENRPA